MLKKAFLLCAVALVLTLMGCGGVDAQISTDLTTFDVISLDYYGQYGGEYGGSITAAEGNSLMVVSMTAQAEFDEKQFKSYFCAVDGSSVARVFIDGEEEYDCIAVAYQGKENAESVEYALVFEVPESAQKAKLIALEVPGQEQVALKGKLPE